MARDPRKEAQQYISEKRVDILFQELGTRLVFERPEDPNAFLLSVLEGLKKNRSDKVPSTFFTSEDVSRTHRPNTMDIVVKTPLMIQLCRPKSKLATATSLSSAAPISCSPPAANLARSLSVSGDDIIRHVRPDGKRRDLGEFVPDFINTTTSHLLFSTFHSRHSCPPPRR